MSERAYYEAEGLWRPEAYERSDERARFELCGRLVPEGAETVLDVGAGQGSFLRWLEQHRPGLALHGLERSRAAVDQSVTETAIQLGSIEALPYTDKAFDVVCALEILEHLPYAVFETGLRELTRVAALAIIVTVPYAEKRELSACSYCGCRFNTHYHMRSFEPESFAALFDGFTLDRQQIVMTHDYLGGTLLRRMWVRLHGGAETMPPGSLCPQCGFRQEAPVTDGAWARRLTTRLPTRQRPKWLAGRFVRE